MATGVEDIAVRLSDGLRKVVVGQDDSILALQIALFGDGHALIEGVPGTAKTLLVRALALLLGADFRRIQFTPDLMPSDVVGTTIFNPQSGQFSTRQGPIFTNLLLADEINRTPPKTQAALLEAMEERQVTIDGVTMPLPPLFIVCATQNPIEYEGTYPLPEAQIDRFMVKASTTYPTQAEELDLLSRSASGFDARYLERAGVAPVVSPADIGLARQHVRAVHVSAGVRQYVYDIVAQTRSAGEVGLGASPRAGLQLLVASQALAAIEGRDFVTPDDVKTSARFVLAHRILIRPEAEVEGVSASAVVKRILDSVAVPKDAEPPLPSAVPSPPA
ncbi:MAG TPA: MoxR family ATPase [Candidatus Eremiobacteraceae bacterium]|nr:MoxR family ATPase [Candidatus Eremiobacteraceae bacterium]